MTSDRDERLVVAFERIATALEELAQRPKWVGNHLFMPQGHPQTEKKCPKCGRPADELPAACPEVECPMGRRGMGCGV